MAMDKTQLAQEIKTALEAITGEPLPGSPDQYLEAFSEALISHIVDNSAVTTTVTIDSGSSAGTYTGTGSVTA